MDRLITTAGISAGWIDSPPYRLAIHRRGDIPASGRLHVYLEGDGRPWHSRSRIATDPTPRDPLALRLMARDPTPALYLSRPCYQGQAEAPGCNPWHWTAGRYSETVVAAMADALRATIAAEGIEALVLIGYSGGGVLAWLLAERIPQVVALVTIAANLDVAAWTAWHGYSPLTDSLDPARREPLRANLRQYHVVGTRDRNVPPTLSAAMLARLAPHARRILVEADHRCCWEAVWPELLGLLEAPAAPEQSLFRAGAVDFRRGRCARPDRARCRSPYPDSGTGSRSPA